MAILVTGPSVPAIEVQLQNVVLSGGVQADWSQNDVQAADFVKNRPGAYMTDPVATEIYNGILPEMASIQMDYVPTLGDVVTVKVGTESIDCTVGTYEGSLYFATAPLEDIAGGSVANCVICVYQQSAWIMQTGGTYTGQNAVFEAAIRQVVKIPEKFLELENVKDVYWITFEFDQKTKTYFSKKIDGTYAEYTDIKAAIDNGKLVAAVASVFGESNNVGLVDGYGKYMNGMSVSFYIVSKATSFELARYAVFNWKSGHTWEKIESTIRPYNGVPLKSELSGSKGTEIGYARGDHVHPLNVALQYVGEQIDGNSKTVQLGNIGDGLPYTGHGLNIPVRASITLSSDEISFLPVTFEWTGYAKLEFSRKSIDYVATLTYSACDDTWTLETNQPLTNATLTYNAVPAQTKDYQKYVLAPYTVAPHLLLASQNGLHKLTVDDNGNVLVDGVSVDGTVTEASIEKALGYKPIGAADVPVKSVNGASGEVKSTFYVMVTPTGSGYAATANKTAAEVYAAYVAGYAVYAIVNFPGMKAPFELPLVAAASISDTIVLSFGALGSINPTDNPQYPTVAYTGMEWRAWLGTLAKKSDIPMIPTELKNPYSLNIKVGETTTSYDGSSAKTVEIPKQTYTLTDAQVSSAVDTWLTEHPEATTTVQDGSVSAQKLAGYSTECRDIPWTLFLDGYKTIAGDTQEDAGCAVYAVKFEAGKTYCLTGTPYPVNTNEFVTDPDVRNFGWYRAYSALPDVAANLAAGRDRLYGQFSWGILTTIMTQAVSDGYIEPAIPGQTSISSPQYFTVKQDWYLLRASVKPNAGQRVNSNLVAEVPAGMTTTGNGAYGQSWGVYKKDLGNDYASDRGYLQQIFASKTANAENQRAYAAMSRDVPRDRTLCIQFIGDSITWAASNAGLSNAFRKYVPMNLRAQSMALCQSGASVTTGSGSFDWNGKQNTDTAYDAAMSGYSGLVQKLAEYKTNLTLKMWADAVDIVVVELGTNDHWEQATLGVPTDLTEDTNFYGAVEKTLTLLEETFPNAQIMWLLPFKNQKWKTSTVKMVDYLIALKILCQTHTRCWVLDLFDKWFLNYDDADVRSKFFRDSVHITGDAHKCVAESMIDKIRQIISVCGLRQIETVRMTNGDDSVYGNAANA